MSCEAEHRSGAVYMETDKSVLDISGNTQITGCYAKQGGAIYLKNTVTLKLTGSPEFARNGYTTRNGSIVEAAKGACIYLEQGSKINLSGSPKFSRNILPNQTRITNGSITDYVRQDIYMAGYSGQTASSINVLDELTGDTIWVWPEQSPHKLANEQFAKIGTSAAALSDKKLADTLSHFRNALADSATGCTNGEYLAGVKGGNDNVNWDKMYTVSFKKKDNKDVAVPGAEFTLYRNTRAVATATSADGQSDKGAQGNLLAKGAVEFTSIQIGAYYMKETKVPKSFKENHTTYLVLVGTPYLSKNDANKALWEGDGPLDVSNAETLVQRYTTNIGKYIGIFPLDANGKAILRANLVIDSVGIENVRNDYQVAFMKVDGSGAALPGAEFTIYTAVLNNDGQPETYPDGYPKLKRWSRDGETAANVVTSADGTSARDVNNTRLLPGVVYFRELPMGTYYLLETGTPERNGSGRRTYYAEEDRVFKLDIEEDENNASGIRVTLSEWKPTAENKTNYVELGKNEGDYYLVDNREVICKLTDGSDKLLYTQGHRVWEQGDDATGEGTARLFPAVYATLEEGFAAAQTGTFVYADGKPAANVSSLKLKVLKDCAIDKPITYNSERKITFTTAETKKQGDKYIFSTTRTSDTARALISRAYNENTSDNANAGALITLENGAEMTSGADMTLQNIRLNGQKGSYNGRAIHVKDGGALTILNNTQIERFKQTAAKDSTDNNDLKGGAILMDEGTSLTINGGYNRTAVFLNNEIVNGRTEGKTAADGGAIAVGANCSFSITNAQFTGNSATAATANKGNGGAISINETREAVDALNLQMQNVVFSGNTASYQGGALRTAENVVLNVENCIFQNNTAISGDGGAIAALSKADSATQLTITGGTYTGNKANGGNGGAIKIGGHGTLTIQGNPTMRSNAAQNGGAVYVASAAEATFENGTWRDNKGAENGGAVYVASAAEATFENGTWRDNEATENGGAVYVASAAEATFENGTWRDNKATVNGGAVYVDAQEAAEESEAQIGLRLEGGSLTGNSARLGSAVYVANHGEVALAGGSVTGNKASDANGGAINVGGADVRLYFSGSPVVFNNTDANATRYPQRNVVLSVDSNAVINTDLDGLEGGVVGVYVIDGENKAIFKGHGIMDTPFGTFGDDDHVNPGVFINDRNLALRAVSKGSEDSKIYWDEVVCKLTDGSDALLYQEIEITVNGTKTKLYAPAAYKTLADGFDAAKGTLYYMDGGRFTDSSLKVKMLRDYPLEVQHGAPVVRAVTLTTAETEIDSTKVQNDGDTMTFSTVRTKDDKRAHITRAFEGDSMLAINRGGNLTVADIVLDGGAIVNAETGENGDQSTEGDGGQSTGGDGGQSTGEDGGQSTDADGGQSTDADGGIVAVNAGTLSVQAGASLRNSVTTGKGGAIYVASGASVTLNGGEISGNEANNGGAVYAAANASVTIKDGSKTVNGTPTATSISITGNTAATGGAGIYLAEGAALKLEGGPIFNNNTVTDGENYPGDPPKTNGGEQVYAGGKLRQDIFLEGYFGKVSAAQNAAAKPATSIVVTGNITSAPGSIWVWAEKPDGDQPDNHYETLKQFAVVEPGKTISPDSYLAFRNAQDDGVTLCGAEYLTGEAGDDMIDAKGTTWKTIRWKGGGFDFSFKKIDGFGNPLPGAKFTLFRGYAFEAATKAQTLTEPIAKGTEAIEATSSDGNAKNSKDETIDEGVALFEKVPQGIHFMLESSVPDGYLKTTGEAGSPVVYTKAAADSTPEEAVNVGATVYVVLLGEAALKIPEDKAGPPWEGVLADIKEADIKGQTGEGDEARNYAIFKIDPDTGRAVAVPDIATYGILDESAARRKVILRKVEEDAYTPLAGAEFEILRYDRTPVSVRDDEGKQVTVFTSLSSGVYFIDKLPYGTYYLHEQKNADGEDVDLWFILTVNDKGVGYETEDSTIINRLKQETKAP